MPKKKMTLKEFAERYECCYSAAGVRLKKLIAKDKKFAKHVSRKGRTYLLDEYAAELLKPKSTKRASVSSSDIEKLKELNDAPFLAGHSTEHKPEKYTEKVNHIFEVLGISLFECYDMTEKLYNEVNEIVSEINNFLNEESSDERKQINLGTKTIHPVKYNILFSPNQA